MCDMVYQSRTKQFKTEPFLYNTTLVFNTTENVDLPSGLTVSEPVEKFRRQGALYRNTQTLIASIEGFNAKTDFTYAIRKQNNDPLGKLDFDNSMIVTIASYPDINFSIQQISQADNSMNSYHLMTIRRTTDSN